MKYDIEFKSDLKRWAEQYNTPAFIENDPVQFPRKYINNQADAEVSGLLTALISFGIRKQIIKKAQELDDMFQGSPVEWIIAERYWRNIPNNDNSFYRTVSNAQMIKWCIAINHMISIHGSIEDCISFSCKVDCNTPHFELKSLLGFNENSAAKKVAMFLRWMVRNDGIVDLGLWRRMSSKDLIIPLDTHVHRMALELDITKRKTTDIKTAQEITDYFKTIWPNDPCLGDFALFGYGVNNK